jgi:hypothetical protein
MDRSREVLRIATFRTLVLMRKDAAQGEAPCVAYTPPGHPNTGDRHGTLMRAEFLAQSIDHRGNFFRLPPNGPAGQIDPETSHCFDAAGSSGNGRSEHAGSCDRRKANPLGIPLVKEVIPKGQEQVDVGLRILADPDVAPDPVLRLRQDRRVEILSQAEFGGNPEPVVWKHMAESFTKKDPGREQPGKMVRRD